MLLHRRENEMEKVISQLFDAESDAHKLVDKAELDRDLTKELCKKELMTISKKRYDEVQQSLQKEFEEKEKQMSVEMQQYKQKHEEEKTRIEKKYKEALEAIKKELYESLVTV